MLELKAFAKIFTFVTEQKCVAYLKVLRGETVRTFGISAEMAGMVIKLHSGVQNLRSY